MDGQPWGRVRTSFATKRRAMQMRGANDVVVDGFVSTALLARG